MYPTFIVLKQKWNNKIYKLTGVGAEAVDEVFSVAKKEGESQIV